MSLEGFLNQFYAEYDSIVKDLTDLSNRNDKPSDEQKPQEKIDLAARYDLISQRSETLQKYFTENASFITQYESRKAQEQLNNLKRLAQEKRELLFPKKKFGFKSKQNMTSLADAIVVNAKTEAGLNKNATSEQIKSKLNIESTCTVKDMSNERVCKKEDDVNGKDVALVNLKDAFIQLHGNPSVLHVSDVTNVTVLCGPISGSAFINNCKNSRIILACHQLRIHETHDTQFYMHVGSRAIIENCSNVRFAPYAWSYEDIDRHFKMSGLDFRQTNWTSIDDFNWLNQTQKSPNWSFLNETERSRWITDKDEQTVESKP
jgi:tubulin-specific chaperone C